jgi:hypothetical protein
VASHAPDMLYAMSCGWIMVMASVTVSRLRASRQNAVSSGLLPNTCPHQAGELMQEPIKTLHPIVRGADALPPHPALQTTGRAPHWSTKPRYPSVMQRRRHPRPCVRLGARQFTCKTLSTKP